MKILIGIFTWLVLLLKYIKENNIMYHNCNFGQICTEILHTYYFSFFNYQFICTLFINPNLNNKRYLLYLWSPYGKPKCFWSLSMKISGMDLCTLIHLKLCKLMKTLCRVKLPAKNMMPHTNPRRYGYPTTRGLPTWLELENAVQAIFIWWWY